MSAPVLQLRGVGSGYGRTTVLRDVDLTVPEGAIVALLGPNGAGKTTTLKTIAGLLRATAGTVEVDGRDVTTKRAAARARAGVCLIPEGRGVFPSMTVEENLRLQVPSWADDGFEPALEVFPVLKDRLGQRAGSMSGGQQQMLALSRCFLAAPRVALLDEVSMGLAPRIVDEIFDALLLLRDRGTALLLVEQYVTRAMAIADELHLLDRGAVAFSGTPSETDEAELLRRYVGAVA